MKKRNLILLGFLVVAAAQLAVPAWMIFEHEQVLKKGQVFKFRTRPVDPADAFRGRYVWLSLEPGMVQVSNAHQWKARQKAFAVLGTDSDGFAIVQRLESERPKNEAAVLVRVIWPNASKGEVNIQWPDLDRYYMSEDQAPTAEIAYRQRSTRTNRNCYVTVFVSDKRAVIKELYIENRPVHQWLIEHPEQIENQNQL